MALVLKFWRPDLNGQPQKVQCTLDPNPLYWPPINDAVIEVRGEVYDLDDIIAAAREHGWGFNPHTKTFYRLD